MMVHLESDVSLTACLVYLNDPWEAAVALPQFKKMIDSFPCEVDTVVEYMLIGHIEVMETIYPWMSWKQG